MKVAKEDGKLVVKSKSTAVWSLHNDLRDEGIEHEYEHEYESSKPKTLKVDWELAEKVYELADFEAECSFVHRTGLHPSTHRSFKLIRNRIGKILD